MTNDYTINNKINGAITGFLLGDTLLCNKPSECSEILSVILESINETKEIDLFNIMEKISEWYVSGDSVNSRVSIAQAVRFFMQGMPVHKIHIDQEEMEDDVALLFALPFAISCLEKDTRILFQHIQSVVQMFSNNNNTFFACNFFACAIRHLVLQQKTSSTQIIATYYQDNQLLLEAFKEFALQKQQVYESKLKPTEKNITSFTLWKAWQYYETSNCNMQTAINNVKKNNDSSMVASIACSFIGASAGMTNEIFNLAKIKNIDISKFLT